MLFKNVFSYLVRWLFLCDSRAYRRFFRQEAVCKMGMDIAFLKSIF